jgi:hypothetical protein
VGLSCKVLCWGAHRCLGSQTCGRKLHLRCELHLPARRLRDQCSSLQQEAQQQAGAHKQERTWLAWQLTAAEQQLAALQQAAAGDQAAAGQALRAARQAQQQLQAQLDATAASLSSAEKVGLCLRRLMHTKGRLGAQDARLPPAM